MQPVLKVVDVSPERCWDRELFEMTKTRSGEAIWDAASHDLGYASELVFAI